MLSKLHFIQGGSRPIRTLDQEGAAQYNVKMFKEKTLNFCISL